MLIDKPGKKGRIAILNVHMVKVRLAPDVDAEKVAALTPGFSEADLANLVNEAALLATWRKAETAILQYINGFYNRCRRRSAPGWKSPAAFERKPA